MKRILELSSKANDADDVRSLTLDEAARDCDKILYVALSEKLSTWLAFQVTYVFNPDVSTFLNAVVINQCKMLNVIHWIMLVSVIVAASYGMAQLNTKSPWI